jgi:hypothetical protein
VLDRAGHHARNVEDIALCVAGAIVWRKDPDADLEVFERDGEMKNVLWFAVDGRRLVVSYNHTERAIEIREQSTREPVLRSFTNKTSPKEVRLFFEKL